MSTSIYHILNGDSLAHSFPDAKIQGDIIVVREALIEGDLSGETLRDFWKTRAKFIGIAEAEYNLSVVKEFEKILDAPDKSEFNLWFEYDLFCQVNMWFVISMINSLTIQKSVYAVYSSHLDTGDKHFWNGFGPADSDQLRFCFAHRILLTEADLHLGHELWQAYKNDNLNELKRLSKIQNPAFPYLKEVVEAHIERFPKEGIQGRPERVLEDIMKNISTDFHKVIQEFWNREGIYGFGDSQLKNIYDKIMQRQ